MRAVAFCSACVRVRMCSLSVLFSLSLSLSLSCFLCVRACVRACLCECVRALRACACVRVRACVRACACVRNAFLSKVSGVGWVGFRVGG